MGKRVDHITQSDEHNARGIDLADRGWLDEAMREFRKAIELDPASSHAHDNLGTVLAEKGELFEAMQEYMEAVRVDPESPSAHHYLGTFLASHGHDLAINEHRRAIDLDPDFADAHLNLALSLAERGLLDDAIAELEIAHTQEPNDEMIEHELACCLIDVERYPEAIGHLKRIIRNFPEHIEAFVDLGIAFTAQGFYAEAEATLQRALAIDDVDFAAHYHLAALYAVWGKSQPALTHLEVAAKRDNERMRQWLRHDRLFDSLRQEDRFAKLLA
jgi:tetratricopeptide (TPR) repeat protein